MSEQEPTAPAAPAPAAPAPTEPTPTAPTPTRRIHALPAVLAALLMIVALIFRHDLVAWFTGTSKGSTSSTTNEKPGEPTAASAGSGSGGDVAYYTCSMHPQVHSNHPGTCPICSMPLTPVTVEAQQAGVIQIDEGRKALLGISTTKVTHGDINLEIRAQGKLVVDETRLHDITLKVGGYVSKLVVSATGQRVNKGDTLFTLYSPDLYGAQQEYLIARSNRDTMHTSGDSTRSDALVKASETKLKLLGLDDAQLRDIVAKNEAIERLPFRSPASGVVMEKDVVEGDAVTAGQRLFRIADLDQIWVEAELYEADFARIKKGQAATVTLTYLPGRTFEGKVAFVYPYLDPASRTGRVRISLANKGVELKPDMFATVAFKLPLGDKLQIPSTAVVYTGPRRLVFIDLGGGRFKPQEVTVGARSGDQVEVLSGLKEGDTIVTSGNFLVAAESRVRSGGTVSEDGSANR